MSMASKHSGFRAFLENRNEVLTIFYHAFREASPDIRLDDMFKSQRDAAIETLRAVHNAAIHSIRDKDRSREGQPLRDPHVRAREKGRRRPHAVYVLNGGRGTGKTSTLLALEKYLQVMRTDLDHRAPANPLTRANPAASEHLQNLRQDLDLALRDVKRAGSNKQTALVMPIVISNDMEDDEQVMMPLFSEFAEAIDVALEETGIDNTRKKDLADLKEELASRVVQPWLYSKRLGLEALKDDSLDFDDFSERYSSMARRSFQRMDSWYGFVERALDVLGYEVLVPIFDDTDLRPTRDGNVLDEISAYLSSPRIITLMAADIPNWQLALEYGALPARGNLEALALLETEADNTIAEMVTSRIRAARAKLNKVLPPNSRLNICMRSRSELDEIFRRSPRSNTSNVGTSDAGPPVVPTYTALCVGLFQYFGEQGGLPGISLKSRQHKDNQPTRARLEEDDMQRDALTWWMLNSAYSGLPANTVRSYMQFLRPVLEGLCLENHNIVLEETYVHPFALLCRHDGMIKPLDDAHGDVPSYISTIMRALQTDEENANEVSGSSFGWNIQGGIPDEQRYRISVVDLWLDVELARHKLDIELVDGAAAWYPSSIGNIAGFENTARHDLKLGVSGFYPSLPIPANCIYTYQLRYLDQLLGRAKVGPRKTNLPKRLLAGRDAHIDERVWDEFLIDLTATNRLEKLKQLGESLAIVRATSPLGLGFEQEEEIENFIFPALATICDYMNLIEGDGFSVLQKIVSNNEENAMYRRTTIGDIFNDFQKNKLSEIAHSSRLEEFKLLVLAIQDFAAWQQDINYYATCWVSAVHLAVLGGDFTTHGTMRAPLPISLSFSDHQKDRLQKITASSKIIFETKSLRTKILYAIAIADICQHAMRINMSPDETDDDKMTAWTKILEFVKEAESLLGKLIEGPTIKARDQKTVSEFLKVIDKTYIVPDETKMVAENLLEAQMARTWYFPDMSDEMLAEMKMRLNQANSEIRKGLKSFGQEYQREKLDEKGLRLVEALSALFVGLSELDAVKIAHDYQRSTRSA